MTDEMFRAVLETAGARADKDGWTTFPDGRLMTLYAARQAVPLTVTKVEAVKTAGRTLWARTTKSETFILALDDLFASAVDRGHETASGRKAGFLG